MSFNLLRRVHSFIDDCRLDLDTWMFASSPGGSETLYASCFAAMLLHYIGELEALSGGKRHEWAEYINSWQDPESGLFLGPELVPDEMHSRKHSFEHISLHLTAHVLPTLELLGARPKYPLSFAARFTDHKYLHSWLEARDWRDAWLEGNNLIFVGQFLLHIRDVKCDPAAETALDLYFQWLDQQVDPDTGLWGTNGYCSIPAAVYGGYHQLLLYYYENQEVSSPDRLVDVVLSLQHEDGGFHPAGGGGACEDVDAIDILVNMYKLNDYKRPQIRMALRKALPHVLCMQMEDGGFVYRRDEDFVHMGIERTASPANRSNLFPTWFRVLTLALISEILTDQPLAHCEWNFNACPSMGWHRSWDKTVHQLRWRNRFEERLIVAVLLGKGMLREGLSSIRRMLSVIKHALRSTVR